MACRARTEDAPGPVSSFIELCNNKSNPKSQEQLNPAGRPRLYRPVCAFYVENGGAPTRPQVRVRHDSPYIVRRSINYLTDLDKGEYDFNHEQIGERNCVVVTSRA